MQDDSMKHERQKDYKYHSADTVLKESKEHLNLLSKHKMRVWSISTIA